MVRTGWQIPITEHISNFFFAIWGLIYLFFATIFTDPKNLKERKKFGASGFGGNIHGIKRGGNGPAMGGG